MIIRLHQMCPPESFGLEYPLSFPQISCFRCIDANTTSGSFIFDCPSFRFRLSVRYVKKTSFAASVVANAAPQSRLTVADQPIDFLPLARFGNDTLPPVLEIISPALKRLGDTNSVQAQNAITVVGRVLLVL